MKKLILSMALVCGMTTAAMAQGKPHSCHASCIEQMISDLGLNEAQAKEFKAVMGDMKQGKKESGDCSSCKEKKKDWTQMNKKLKSILTEEQYKKFQKMKSKCKKNDK